MLVEIANRCRLRMVNLQPGSDPPQCMNLGLKTLGLALHLIQFMLTYYTMTQIDIADLDCIFLTYAEPQKEEFWIRVRNIVPWAKRVDGVKGSDAAHKAAAQASDTERFVLIDGDNIPDQDFFNKTLILDDTNKDCVFRWKACNVINNLRYGNGGLSCWTKTFVNNMRTHENTDGRSETLVEFCFDKNYWAMHDVYSKTYPNQTPEQAFKAGFREGVKLCLDQGKFTGNIHPRNKMFLEIWHNLGKDVENGNYAILGARLGTYKLFATDWDYTEVRDFDRLDEIWTEKDNFTDVDTKLKDLDFNILDLNSEQSKFFKRHQQIGRAHV